MKFNNFLLPNLETINLDNNHITRAEGFPQANLKKLQYLCLQNNELREINLVNSDLDSLTYLDLRYNKLVTVIGLEAVRNLRSIDMNNNQITKIVWGQALLDQVTTINLSKCRLTVVDNRLTSFEGFTSNGARWKDLVHLNLSLNQIASVDLQNLSLKFLKTIVLQDNKSIKSVHIGKCHLPELTYFNVGTV